MLLLAYLGVGIVINDAVDHPDRFAGVLNWPPIAWVGRLSYSLYIWQQVFCWKSPLGWLGHFPQNLVATLVMSSASYYLVEQPFAKIRVRFRFDSTTPNQRHAAPGAEMEEAIKWASH